MSERWTSPKAGPFPSGHLVQFEVSGEPAGLGKGADEVKARCGPWRNVRPEQVAAFTSEPPPTSEGRTCETCLRLANRDHIEAIP